MAMKRISHIFILLIFLSLSGCMTKIYLGKEKEPEKVLSDDMVMSSRAIDPTTVPAGGTWGTVRGILNTNFSNINGSLDSIEVTTARHEADIDTLEQEYLDHADSLAVHRIAIDGKMSIADTAAMLNPYAKLSDLSEGGIGISAVQDEIADSLNVLRTNIAVGDGTKGPFFDGSADGGQTLTFYGDNGFWTALQGGAPTANRSYRLPIAALPGAGTTSLINIDQYGNMGFAFNGIPATLTATELGYSDGVTSSIQNQLNAKVNASDTAAMLAHYALLSEIGTGGDISTLKTRVDSLVDVLADSINIETLLQIDFDTDTLAKLSDVRSLAGSGVVGVTLNSGTLTLTGDAGTADDITFYTNGDGQYDLPAGGGNLTIQSQVQAWISDTADVIRDMIMDSILLRIEPIFVFGAGGGMPTDTATFQNGVIAGVFYNSGSDTLKITSIRGVLAEGTGTETIGVQVSWHATFKSASAVNLNSSAYTITSITTGNEDTSFANDEIPPGVWVWCTLSGASANNKPTLLSLTMSGYKIPRY